MNGNLWHQAVNSITAHFGRRAPDRVRVSEMHDIVEHIPDAAVEWIVKRIKTEADNLPANLTKQFCSLWRLYQQEHPASAPAFQATKCDECRGYGLIWYIVEERDRLMRDGRPYRYEMRARCRHCENWRQHFSRAEVAGPAATRGELEAKGYELAPISRRRERQRWAA